MSELSANVYEYLDRLLICRVSVCSSVEDGMLRLCGLQRQNELKGSSRALILILIVGSLRVPVGSGRMNDLILKAVRL